MAKITAESSMTAVIQAIPIHFATSRMETMWRWPTGAAIPWLSVVPARQRIGSRLVLAQEILGGNDPPIHI